MTAGDLGISILRGRPLAPEQQLYPLARALPMGWSWSLHFAQSANSFQMSMVPSMRNLLEMSDRGPPLLLGAGLPGGRYTYVDNLGCIASGKSLVEDGLKDVVHYFNKLGLVVHEPG